jgi:hypothetical protein
VSSRQLDSFSDGGIRQSTLVAVFSGIQGRFPLRAHAVEPPPIGPWPKPAAPQGVSRVAYQAGSKYYPPLSKESTEWHLPLVMGRAAAQGVWPPS